MPKIYFKPKAGKGKKPLKPLKALKGLAYDIKISLKYILKTKAQPKEYLEYKDIIIYTPYIKSRKNKGLIYILFIF